MTSPELQAPCIFLVLHTKWKLFYKLMVAKTNSNACLNWTQVVLKENAGTKAFVFVQDSKKVIITYPGAAST